MRIAYFTSIYPMVSLSFIRREIHALEASGLEIQRYSIRPWGDELVDPQDIEEHEKTETLLEAGMLSLLFDTLCVLVSRPIRFIRVLKCAISMSRTSDRSLFHHLAYFIEGCGLLRRLLRNKIDHVHVHFATNGSNVAMLCKLLGGPTYSFTVHGPFDFDVAMVQNFREKIGHASFVVAISSYTRSQLYRWCDYSEWHKVHIIHCGVDQKFLQEPPPLDPESRTLLCIGRLCEQKGQLTFVRAVAELKKQGVEPKVVLAGDGELREEIERLIQEYDLADQITITGWVTSDRVLELVRECRALVMPSFAEGLPVAIMEAYALGRPVVSTYIAGIPELVRPGVNGWLVPASDVDQLVDAIREVMAAPVERLVEMGLEGNSRVRRDHDAEIETARLKKLFELCVRHENSKTVASVME